MKIAPQIRFVTRLGKVVLEKAYRGKPNRPFDPKSVVHQNTIRAEETEHLAKSEQDFPEFLAN
jgi:hypothetical protein